MEPTKSDAVRWGSGHGVVVLLALAAIVAAIIGARASLLGIDASDGWQQSVEDEQRRGSILMWDVRSVYGDKGELAFAIAIEEIRAAGLLAASDAAAPDIAARLLAEAQIREGVAEAMRQSSTIASDPRFLLPSGGYDLQLSLADTRAGLGDELDIDPMASVSGSSAVSARSKRLRGPHMTRASCTAALTSMNAMLPPVMRKCLRTSW